MLQIRSYFNNELDRSKSKKMKGNSNLIGFMRETVQVMKGKRTLSA